jgi:tRNA pseudouridine13 synthase
MSESELPRAHGGAPLRGLLRATHDDFLVEEDLGFMPSGAGEHALVVVEKRGANTEWVARQLATYAGVAPFAVSFAGMKDRHALTRQTFSLHLPGKANPDWAQLQNAEFRILDAQRHNRKLKRGALKGNRFRIVLREVSGDQAAVEQSLILISAQGVPNYFGEQRFGRDGGNVAQARAMFAGRRVQRSVRGLLLSAARSHLFNNVLAERVLAGHWNQALPGDVWMLHGSHAIFGPEPISDDIQRRLHEGDIDPTAPLWGRGVLRSTDEVALFEQAVIQRDPDLANGLETAGLEQERRALRLRPRDLAFEWLPENALAVSFWLPAGAYATTLLREFCDYRTGPTFVADEAAELE